MVLARMQKGRILYLVPILDTKLPLAFSMRECNNFSSLPLMRVRVTRPNSLMAECNAPQPTTKVKIDIHPGCSGHWQLGRIYLQINGRKGLKGFSGCVFRSPIHEELEGF